MEINRKKNALLGTINGIALRFTQILFPFIIRTIFIKTIGIEYLGLNSLFTSILQVLNLAELGVSSALVFSMYRPIAEGDTSKVCQLMNLYKLYYWIIGAVILIIGLCLIPMLRILVKRDLPDNINLYVLYAMHLSTTVLSYWLFAYRNSLFLAHQRNDVISLISLVIYIILYSLQILALLISNSYYLYLSLVISAQIIINLVTAYYSKKYYPQYSPEGMLPSEERREINHKVQYLFTAKIGGVVNNSADSIVISAILGLSILGVYQNYYFIISAAISFISIFFLACVAGVGNSLVVNNTNQNRKLLYNINHIEFFLINVCCACFLCVCQPFINLWVGKDYLLDFRFVILFTIYLFVELAPRTLLLFKDAGGIWKEDRFRPLIAAGANLIMNLILTTRIGLYGIIISTISALFFIAYPWLIVNINKHLFEINLKKYVFRTAFYTFVITFDTVACYFLCTKMFFGSDLVTVVVRFVLTAILSSLLFVVLTLKFAENKYMLGEFKRILKKVIH